MSENPQVAELLQQGITAAKAGRKQEAREALLAVVELDERNEQAWLWLSGAVETLADRRVCIENVLAINPDNALAQAGLRWLAQREAASPPVPEPDPDGQDRCPRCGGGLPVYGKRCTACGQLVLVACPACGRYLDVVEQTCPECGEFLGDFREGAAYYLRLVRAYLAGAQPSVAEETMPSAVAEAGDNADLLVEVGGLYERLNRLDRAMAVFQRAVEHGCDDGAVYARLGELYQQSGMADEAQVLYAQARRHAGDNPEFLLAQARYHLTRDPASRQGIELLQRALQLAPEHATAHLLLARVYHVRDNTDAAVTHLRQAAQLADANTETGRDARRELGRLGTEASYQPSSGWGETIRNCLGMVLVPLLAALANARLSLLRIGLPAWFALLVATLGAYLVASGMDVPQNPGMCLLFGDEGAKERSQRLSVGLPGAALWFLGLGAILLRV